MGEKNRSTGQIVLALAFFLILIILSLPAAGIPGPVIAVEEPGCDPRPPLDLRIVMDDFAPGPPGGLASISIEIEPHAAMGEIEVSVRLLQGMRFGDGSTDKDWRIAVPAGSLFTIPEVIQVPGDGLFLVKLDAGADLDRGGRVRRSRGLRIFAGVEPVRPQARGRALEYPARETEDPLP